MGEGSGLIVVGVDGSPHARRALDWALREARIRSGRCLLIHAYGMGIGASAPGGVAPLEEIAAAAGEVLEHELAFARESGLVVEGHVVAGGAARALLDASHGADLLVVGSRGRGGFTGALLGSVSTACVHHATCPVVVVPPPDRVGAGVD
jgi:nucleotide-binding universal stress UspA family protein